MTSKIVGNQRLQCVSSGIIIIIIISNWHKSKSAKRAGHEGYDSVMFQNGTKQMLWYNIIMIIYLVDNALHALKNWFIPSVLMTSD